jgi:hypothetical protein
MGMKTFFSKKSIDFDYKTILYNSVVLYVLVFISLTQLFLFLNTNDIQSFFIFLLIGFLVSFFNKNMIVIIVIALSITNIFKYGIQGVRLNEGFENEESDNKNDKKENEKPGNKKEIMADISGNSTNKPTIKPSSELKSDLENFQQIQQQITEGLEKMTPLLEKADTFIEKYKDFS